VNIKSSDGELELADAVTRRFLLTREDHQAALRLLARVSPA
jgi:hypothetical protein